MCLLFFLEVQLPKAGFSKSCIYYYYYYYLFFYFFIRQSVIVFQEIGKNPKKETERERKKKIDTFPELSCFRKSGINEW